MFKLLVSVWLLLFVVANTASPRKGGNLDGRQTTCLPFKAGCELGLATITLSTFPLQGSPFASGKEGRINTATGQPQILAQGNHDCREKSLFGDQYLAVDCCLHLEHHSGTTSAPLPIVFLHFGFLQFGTSFGFVVLLRTSLWFSGLLECILLRGVHVCFPHITSDL